MRQIAMSLQQRRPMIRTYTIFQSIEDEWTEIELPWGQMAGLELEGKCIYVLTLDNLGVSYPSILTPFLILEMTQCTSMYVDFYSLFVVFTRTYFN
jgi:hypothetical protein